MPIVANQRLLELNEEGVSAASEREDERALNQVVNAVPPNQPAMNGDEATSRLLEP